MYMVRNLKMRIRKRICGVPKKERSIAGRKDLDARKVKVVCFLLRCLLIYPGTKTLTLSGMSVFQRLAFSDGTIRRMLLSWEDKDLRRLSSITVR